MSLVVHACHTGAEVEAGRKRFLRIKHVHLYALSGGWGRATSVPLVSTVVQTPLPWVPAPSLRLRVPLLRHS